MDSVLLADPVCLIGLIISLTLCIVAAVKKNNIAITAAAAVIFVSTVTYALFKGADLYEAGAAAAIFLIISLIPFWREGGEK